jgi:aminoglycoside 3-N-acetyltransferase
MNLPAICSPTLSADLRRLGLPPGAVVIVHTRMSALGWVVGGSESVVRALLDAVGPEGTVVAYAGWQEHVYRPEEWAAEHRDVYAADPPVFDPRTAEAVHDHGRIPERIRTWPGVQRSDHPEANVVAIGARAGAITERHAADDGYGPTSPFARIVEAGGHVLMLGAPLDTITLLHHAEALADVPGKRFVTFTIPVREGDRVTERTYTDLDTSGEGLPYDGLRLDDDPFAVIAAAALEAGIGTRGRVGHADSHLFPARELTAFAVDWLERRFR